MKPRPIDGYFFEDYAPGARFVHATPRTVTTGDIALYTALTGSRFAPQSSEPLAQRMGYARQPVDDLLVFHIAFGKTVPDVSYNAVANLGYADIRWLSPVYTGDTIRAESEVIGLKPNSNGKTGVVYVHSNAFVQRPDGGEVPCLTWARWVMVAKRDPAAPATTHEPPKLPAKVEPEQLAVPSSLSAQALAAEHSGGTRFWDDYLEGEYIDHPGGMTVNDSDHSLATRLYQNTARVHFDGFGMSASRFGKRLVYGGHVISLCRALSFDGLENAFAIAAINGGAHAHPTFAGDTLYARSIVVEKWKLAQNSSVGALRLKLIGVKNAKLADVPYTAIASEDERIVLDLDYTVLMPVRA